MDIRASRYFAAVAQHNSIRDAADALNVAQSALSRQILKLEETFGVRLFERLPRGVTLTAAGEVYLRYARDQIAQAEHMRAEFHALNGMHRGRVRISAIESLTRSLLPRLIAAFREQHPGVGFDVKMDGSERIIEAVREIDTDIGITYYSQPASDLAVTRQCARAAGGDRRCGARFGAEEEHWSARCRGFPDGADDSGFAQPQPDRYGVLEGRRIAVAGAGDQLGRDAHRPGRAQRTVTFLLRLSAEDGVRAGTLAAVPVRSEILNMGTIEVLTRVSRKLSPVSEEFLGFLGTELASGG